MQYRKKDVDAGYMQFHHRTKLGTALAQILQQRLVVLVLLQILQRDDVAHPQHRRRVCVSRPTPTPTRHDGHALREAGPLLVRHLHLQHRVVEDGQVLQALHGDLIVQRLTVPTRHLAAPHALHHRVTQEAALLVLQRVDHLHAAERRAEALDLRHAQLCGDVVDQHALRQIIPLLRYASFSHFAPTLVRRVHRWSRGSRLLFMVGFQQLATDAHHLSVLLLRVGARAHLQQEVRVELRRLRVGACVVLGSIHMHHLRVRETDEGLRG